MSFLSVLKSIGHGFEIGVADASKFSGLISAVPVFGGPAVSILNAVTAIEGLLPSGNGAAKKTAVTAVVTATNPEIPAATVSTGIDEVVAALNQLAAAMAKIQAETPAPSVPKA